MKILRSQIIACLVLILSAPLHADDKLIQPVAKYLTDSTAIVAWVDVDETDFDGLQSFARTYEVQTGPMPNARIFQKALKTLDVKRAFVIASLQELISTQPLVVLPSTAEKVATVELIASATFENHPVAVRTDGTNVLIGSEATLETYVTQPPQSITPLLTAIAETKHSSAAILRIPPGQAAMLLPLLPELLKRIGATPEDIAAVSEGVASLQTVSVSSSIPPVAGALRITLNSNKAAQQLTKTVNSAILRMTPESADGFQLITDGPTVIHEAKNAKQIKSTMDCIAQLLTPAHLSAKQRQHMNSLKQIGLAMHNYHDVYGFFPPHALSSKDGSKLLSWRVLILPLLGEVELYKKFRLNEPWDSEHNIKLVDEIPFVYSGVIPGKGKPDGKTRMQAPLHPQSVFGGSGAGTQFRQIIDGTSNTLLVVQVPAASSAIWTKPQDIVVDENDIKASLIAVDSDKFLACICDGSVKALSAKNTNETLLKLITMNGREVIGKMVDELE